ncbi:MAG: 5'/3'-nucleotidase SurE [Alcanivoracaceae bacterium]|nr:5'/3'-nucleotidase SurE [Alcanivoracaceae bacterium]
MRILLTNDDGIFAEGIKVLANTLAPIADIYVMAPLRDRSGAGSSISTSIPLRVDKIEEKWWGITGKPADCVKLALSGHIMPAPDMVISGINAGENLGDDVLYSGTLGGAIEGRYLGKPAIAISCVNGTSPAYDTAAKVILDIFAKGIDNPLLSDCILNINVPDLAYEKLRGIKITHQGEREIAPSASRAHDSKNREVFWLGNAGKAVSITEDSDFHAVQNGYVSVTPLQVNMTAYKHIEVLRSWLR